LIGKQPGAITRFAAKLWPLPLVIFLGWILGQWVVGYFFNDFMQQAMYFGLVLIFVTLPLSIYSAYADDFRSALERDKNVSID
jgi:hypothetical protein